MILTLKYVLVFLLTLWMIRQVRKPTGWLGRRVVRAMGHGHASMTDWGLQQVIIPPNATILDIGCGAGFAVRKLAAMACDGKVVGLDFSSTSVAVARDTNAQLIAAGRVNIEQGSVAALPFPDCTFDVVTAMETHYYWPDLPANVREVRRVLKPGGSFVLIAETYRGGPFRFLYALVMPLLRAAYLSDEEHRNLLAEAGLVDVTTQHRSRKNWIVATGKRPL
jgi:ubiquinone/menaquinone biosynthesis C-methylase UbiE